MTTQRVKTRTALIEDKPSAHLVAKRRAAAEDVCWQLLLMMGLGLLDIPVEDREMLAEPMQKWSDLAAECGILGKGE